MAIVGGVPIANRRDKPKIGQGPDVTVRVLRVDGQVNKRLTKGGERTDTYKGRACALSRESGRKS